MEAIKNLLNKLAGILDGEAVRAIGYASGALVYFAGRYIGAFDAIEFGDAVILTTGYVTGMVTAIEYLRSKVFSQNTVDRIVGDLS
jgi:hypothetical protein